MQMVQIVCPERDDFGMPQGDGLPDDWSDRSELYPESLNSYPGCAE